MQELWNLISKSEFSFFTRAEYDKKNHVIHMGLYYIIEQDTQFTIFDDTEVCPSFTGSKSEINHYLQGIELASKLHDKLTKPFYISAVPLMEHLYRLKQQQSFN